MGIDPHAADDALERMLFGAPVNDEWRDVASFVQELQEAIPSANLASEDLHVAAMVETAHLLAEKGDPVVRPVSNAAEPAPQASGLPKQRRKPMRKKMAARILAPVAAAFVVFGGMAYAGALPWSGHTPTSASTLSPSDEDTQDALGEDDQGEDTQGDEGKDDVVTPPADEGDQGENADDQSESSDDLGDSSDEATSDDQGENDDNQGDNDNQGEDSQGDSTDQQSGDDQGDSTGGDQGGDSQSGDTTSGGDQSGDSQD
jgi:hypothetical protein